jgi:hypothetical protein
MRKKNAISPGSLQESQVNPIYSKMALSLCPRAIPRKRVRNMEVNFHEFHTSVLDGEKWTFSASSAMLSDKQPVLIGGPQ